ncbi:type I restriction-modification system subunit M [Agathobacter rectalis]|uniref:site-specific DNA-methyltransferase (adenine-specific) n=2 Tax=Bacteria TaxID=2 RepID=A0AAW4UBH0_9FIRM|nr:class I SAM-dependent DNA methyltransferase [Agathobacter rectalis]MCB6939122.1 type I restriction-modification system subunit M [Agathobacter rectalis]
MARAASAPKKEISMEEALWKSADKLRGSVEPAEYKHVVLSLFFLKFASDKFEAQRKAISEKYGEKFVDNVAFYTKDNVFFLPEISRWSFIMENAKQDDIALKIDTALYTIEKANPALKGALPDNYYSRLHIDTAKLASLLDEIDKINTGDKENDIIGRVYEYFLSKFALAEGKGKGEFYTPKCIVNLIAEMIEPYDGILYDPCCGSGGMFVQSMKFVEAHHGNKKKVSIYGQEYTNTTYKLCKMNLAIRGISANLGEMAANTFTNDQHKDLKADYIMANPPFNQKEWRGDNELIDDPRWDGYEVPPTSNANYGWILNIVSKLSQNGVAGFLLANGALSDDGTELKIRRQLIENNLVEAIIILPRNLFYTTDISVTLWILNKNKKARVVEENGEVKRFRNREREILFMDLRQMGSPYEKKYIELTEEDRAKVTGVYHAWQQEGYEETYQNVPEFCYSASFDEVAEKGFTLVPSRYIEFVNRDENIDFDTNKNKKARVVEENGEVKRFRNREREILFMDLRQMGSPYEKKYIELTEEDRAKVTGVYHAWQQEGYEETYQNVPEFCYSASFDEVAEKGFTLVPSRYIEFVNRDENIDFDTKMKTLQSELRELLVAEEKSKADLLTVFKELGYEIEL